MLDHFLLSLRARKENERDGDAPFAGLFTLEQDETTGSRTVRFEPKQRHGLDRLRLTDGIVAELRRAILSEELKPGDRLPPESELVRLFGVGRSTIREAMRAMAQLGLVRIQQGRGTFVQPNAKEVLLSANPGRPNLVNLPDDQIHEVRSIIEGEMAALAAERAREEDLERMATLIDRMRREANEPQKFLVSDMNFHLALAHAARNQLLEQFLFFAYELFEQVTGPVLQAASARERAIWFYQELWDAVSQKDCASARHLMLDYLLLLQEEKAKGETGGGRTAVSRRASG